MSDMANHDHGHSDMGTHGMLVFGDSTIYLSHLPMFGEPHNFQVLLEVTLTKGADDQADLYRRDRRNSGERIYTLVPEDFGLLELASPSPASPKRDSFVATVFRGHFERGGRPILHDVTVKVTDVLYFQQLDPEAKPEPTATLAYLCFGRSGELFAAHKITARPNFDQVLAVSLSDFDDGQLAFDGAVPLEVERDDAPASRLARGQDADGWLTLNIGNRGEHRRRAKVRVHDELYFESGELA